MEADLRVDEVLVRKIRGWAGSTNDPEVFALCDSWLAQRGLLLELADDGWYSAGADRTDVQDAIRHFFKGHAA